MLCGGGVDRSILCRAGAKTPHIGFQLRTSSAHLFPVVHFTYNRSAFTMFSPVCRRSLRTASAASSLPLCVEATLPAFLVPAFQPSRQRTSQFSTSSQCKSKIGRAPVSIPPEVTFRMTVPPPQKTLPSGISRSQSLTMIEVDGPRGKMSLSLPPYMTLQPDESNTAYTLNIEDQEVRKQREMWGKPKHHLQHSK